MCGIVGYIGKENASETLVDGLARLEYRGYDSAGVALQNGHGIQVLKRAGRLAALTDALKGSPLPGHVGIAHTRWATHGAPTDSNAHPHSDCGDEISVVHNGIIDNDQSLRRELAERGHRFRSDTDSEVLAHLIEESYQHRQSPLDAVRTALQKVRGSYAVVVLFQKHPDVLVAARKDSPLIIGLGEGENFIASDVPAIVHRTRDVLVLDDGEVALIDRSRVSVATLAGERVDKSVLHIDWDPDEAEKGGFAHFMLKEIHDQPTAVRDAMAGRLGGDGEAPADLAQIGWGVDRVKTYRRVYLVACGTAYHAGLVGKRLIERTTDLVATAELASEFRYSEPSLGEEDLVIVVSQSGETADTLAALKEAKSQGADVLAVTNVVGSSISREADYVLYTHAGPEIAVASTKAYLTQLVCLTLVALYMGWARGTLEPGRGRHLSQALHALPRQIETVIRRHKGRIRRLSLRLQSVRDVFYLGRSLDYAVAMEGQLKLKEISYIHAEALAAGELKHGTLALIEEGVPVVALVTQNRLFDKSVSNLEEVAARGGDIVALATDDCPDKTALEEAVGEVWYLPSTEAELAPILAAVPLQLLAYYTAVEKGCDVDKPRNLAKSVTVE